MKTYYMFGDSLMRGVMPDEAWNYHSSDAIGFEAMQAQYNMKFLNFAMPTFTSERVKMWLTQIMSNHPVPDVAFLECGGNDCDYNWKDISDAPDGEHLPHTPQEQFVDDYCTAIRAARDAGAKVAMTSLPPLEQERYFAHITKGLSTGSATPIICTAGRSITARSSHSSAAPLAASWSTCGRSSSRAARSPTSSAQTASTPPRPATT